MAPLNPFLASLPRPFLIGVVHLLPTPGAPRFGGGMEEVLERAVSDASALASGGVDALIVENYGDLPFFAGAVPPETIAAMALAIQRVRSVAAPLPVGANVLRNDARAALGLCASAGASFLRINVHTGVTVTDQGWIEGRAAETLRERERLAKDAAILADVHVKHGVPLGSPSLASTAQDTLQRGLADALIVSGSATGLAPSTADLLEVRRACPQAVVLIGSGLCLDNARELLRYADGAIVGTALKRDALVEAPVERVRVERLRAHIRP